MRLATQLAWMTSGTALRLGAGLASFVVMARLLGPVEFGRLMLWLAAATLAALVAGFGFTPYLLREIGARSQHAACLMSEVLTAKLLLSACLLAGALALLPWVSPADRLICLAMLLAQLADTLAEAYSVGLRATQQFAVEARLTSTVALAQLVLVACTLALWPTAQAAALAFLATRLLALVAVARTVLRHVPGVALCSLADARRVLAAGRAYAADTILQSLLGQIDNLVLNHFMGPAAVGLYQAGMRLFNGGAQVGPILANVLLPRAASAHAAGQGGFQAEARRLQWSFLLSGLAIGLVLAGLAQPITQWVFGPAFAGLSLLLPWFGLLFYLRFFAASWGVVLTAAGAQRFRAWANVGLWLLALGLTPWLVSAFGAAGWLLCVAAGHVLLGGAYLWRGLHMAATGWVQPVAALLGLAAFLPFLALPLRVAP